MEVRDKLQSAAITLSVRRSGIGGRLIKKEKQKGKEAGTEGEKEKWERGWGCGREKARRDKVGRSSKGQGMHKKRQVDAIGRRVRKGEERWGRVKIKVQANSDREPLSAHRLYLVTKAAEASFHALMLRESVKNKKKFEGIED